MLLVAIVAVVAVVGLGLVFMGFPSTTSRQAAPVPPAPAPAPAPVAPAGPVEIKVSNKALKFVPDSATVKPGQKVKIITTNEDDTPHTFITQAEKDAKKIGDILEQGKSRTVDFTATQSGEAKFYCSLHPDMLFTLKVAP
jgi:plastocyanin